MRKGGTNIVIKYENVYKIYKSRNSNSVLSFYLSLIFCLLCCSVSLLNKFLNLFMVDDVAVSNVDINN